MSNKQKRKHPEKKTNKQTKNGLTNSILDLNREQTIVEINLLLPKYWVITFVGCFLMQQKENVNMVKAK